MPTPQQENDMFKNLLDLFKPIVDMAKERGEMELAAIWLTDPCHVIDGKTKARFAPADRIRIEDGAVVNGTSNATVTGCYGMLGDLKLTMMVLMDSGEPVIIKLKDVL